MGDGVSGNENTSGTSNVPTTGNARQRPASTRRSGPRVSPGRRRQAHQEMPEAVGPDPLRFLEALQEVGHQCHQEERLLPAPRPSGGRWLIDRLGVKFALQPQLGKRVSRPALAKTWSLLSAECRCVAHAENYPTRSCSSRKEIFTRDIGMHPDLDRRSRGVAIGANPTVVSEDDQDESRSPSPRGKRHSSRSTTGGRDDQQTRPFRLATLMTWSRLRKLKIH